MGETPTPLRLNDPRLDEFAYDHYVAICVFMPLTTIAIALRFYARRSRGFRFALDDLFALLSYITFVVFVSIVIYACKNGAIGHMRTKLPPLNRMRASKAIYSGPILSGCIMTAAKFSVLLLYKRVFSPIKSFRIQIWVVGVLCFAWFFAATLPVIFKCTPIRAGWDASLWALQTTKCINFQAWIVAIEVPSCILDFAIAAIAIGVLRDLKMNLTQKFGLLVLFLLTTVVAIIGLIRIGITYTPNFAGKFSPDANILWITIQNGLTVICCCLPTYGSLLNTLNGQLVHLQNYVLGSIGSSQFSRSQSGRQNGKSEPTTSAHDTDGIPLSSPYWEVASNRSDHANATV